MRLRLAAAALLFGAGLAAGAAQAVTVTASPTTAPVAVTLNGDDQVGTFTETLSVSSEASTGWNITAYAAVPAGSAGSLAQLTITQLPTITCSGGGCTVGSPDATITGRSYPAAVGTTAAGATKIFNSTTNDKKTQVVTAIFGVPVAANEFVGTYTTTLNVAVADGP